LTPELREPPLTPRQAIAITVGGVSLGAIVVVVSCVIYLVPWPTALGWYAVGAFFTVAFPWVGLDWETKNSAVRAHNRFVYFAVAVFVLVLILQYGTEGQPFPRWGIAALIVAGIAAYSVMAYHAVRNFRRWRRGEFGAAPEAE